MIFALPRGTRLEDDQADPTWSTSVKTDVVISLNDVNLEDFQRKSAVIQDWMAKPHGLTIKSKEMVEPRRIELLTS